MLTDDAVRNFYHGKKVVVTGAGGFIGHHLAKELAACGAQVRALVKYNSQSDIGLLSKIDPELLKQIAIEFGDVRDLRMMEKLIKSSEVVFHLAALIGIPYSYVAPGEYVSVNISGTLNILEAVKREGAGRCIVTSTSETYGSAQYAPMDEVHPLQAQSPYAATKIAADQLALSYYRSFNTPVGVIRPFNTFGPGQSLRAVIPTIVVQMLRKSPSIRIGSTFPVRDFNYVADTVAGFLRMGCADNIEGNVINIASGRGVTIGEVYELAKKLIGYQGRMICEEERIRPDKSEVVKLIGKASLAKELLGWSSKVPFEQGLEKVIECFRDNPNQHNLSRYTV